MGGHFWGSIFFQDLGMVITQKYTRGVENLPEWGGGGHGPQILKKLRGSFVMVTEP